MSEIVNRVAKEVMVELHKTIGLDITIGLAKNIARAAIGAMRDPTSAMHDAAWLASLSPGEPMDHDFPDINGGIWQAMIDAAISSGIRKSEL